MTYVRPRSVRARPRATTLWRRASALVSAIVLTLVGTLLLSSPATATTQPNVSGTSIFSHAQVQAKQWWIVRLSLHKAWKITRGKGVTVAVMDTGVDRKFGDLRGALVPGFGVNTHATGDTDDTYHGTRIADDIAGRGTGFGLLGVAPQAQVMPVTIPGTDSGSVAAALNHITAMSNPPRVVNMSFGGPFPCPGAVATATRRAAEAGIVLVASAGNSAQTGNLTQYPANCPGVVGVGAINNSAGVWSQSQRRAYVMLTGPGVHIIGWDNDVKSGVGFADGTSDAAAMVSGIAALILAHSPSMSGRDVVTRMLATARQFSGKQGTRNNRYGYGVALPYNALTKQVAANAPNPVYARLDSGGSPSSSPDSSAPDSSTSNSSTPHSSAANSSTPAGSSSSIDSGATPAPGAASSSSNGSSIGLIIAIVVVVLVIIAIVLAVTVRARRRAVRASHGSGYGPPPGGGYGPPPGAGR